MIADLTRRFPFASSSVDHVRAHDIIEHLPDRIHTMNEIWRVCKDQALVDIRVPSTDGRGAFQDPTQVSYWNANSFRYYSPQFPACFRLCQSYGFKGAYQILDMQEERSADQVVHLHVLLKVIKTSIEAGVENQELIQELRRLNVLLSTPAFNQDTYEHTKTVLQQILRSPRRGEIALFLESDDLKSEDMATILTQLMFDLIVGGYVEDGADLPNLRPAPLHGSTRRILESRLAYQGEISDTSATELMALLNQQGAD